MSAKMINQQDVTGRSAAWFLVGQLGPDGSNIGKRPG